MCKSVMYVMLLDTKKMVDLNLKISIKFEISSLLIIISTCCAQIQTIIIRCFSKIRFDINEVYKNILFNFLKRIEKKGCLV